MDSNAATLFTEVNAASIRLPPFSPNEALTWFRRAETQFRLKNIVKATTKADHQPDEIEYDTEAGAVEGVFSFSI